ncbi:MAG: methyltransferase [Vicinamibacteria bacterium]
MRAASVAAHFEAQKIAFGPVVFQAVRSLRELGILDALRGSDPGLTSDEISEKAGLPRSGVQVLVEIGRASGVLASEDGRHVLTPVGYCILLDEVTRANLDFVHHCCYQGLFHLEQAARESRPAGLHHVFGPWDTIYPAVPALPAAARESWYAWDHLYSDAAFPQALPLVFERGHRTLLDIGGNTGKWALRCVAYDPQVAVTIVDLPEVLALAERAIGERGLLGRVSLHPLDLLDHARPVPSGFDAVWMSQFLVCFAEEDIAGIFGRLADAMAPEATLYILDTFPDRQAHAAAAYALEASSLYFTCLANGRSRMYKAEEIRGLLSAAGFEVTRIVDGLGICSSLLICRRRDGGRGLPA